MEEAYEEMMLGKAPGGDVADDDLQGDDLDLLHHGLPVVQLLHEVGGDTGGPTPSAPWP